MSEPCPIQELPLCPRPHPFGVAYRLQGISDDMHPTSSVRTPYRLFCPYCDFERLRLRGRGEPAKRPTEPSPRAR